MKGAFPHFVQGNHEYGIDALYILIVLNAPHWHMTLSVVKTRQRTVPLTLMDNSFENAWYSEVLVQCKDFKKIKNIWETFVTCFMHNFMVQLS